MKPQQLLNEASALSEALQDHVACTRASFPTLTAIAVALASSVVITFAGCASGAASAPVAQALAPAGVGLDAGAANRRG